MIFDKSRDAKLDWRAGSAPELPGYVAVASELGMSVTHLHSTCKVELLDAVFSAISTMRSFSDRSLKSVTRGRFYPFERLAN